MMLRLLLSSAISLAFAPVAYALNAVPSLPAGVCEGLIGCGSGSSNVVLDNIPDLAMLMITIASGGAVLFLVWAGFKMVIALGDDGSIGEQKTAILYVLGGLGIAIFSQTIVALVGSEPILGGVSESNLPVGVIAAGVGILLTVFNGAFAVAIIVGGVRMVYAQGKSDEFNTGRKIITWSIIGAIIANISNALVQALAGLFGV